MKMNGSGKLSKAVQSRRAGTSPARTKVGRGIGRKRLKLTQSRSSNGRTDEDSGLGGETSTTDSVFEESSKSYDLTLSSYFLAVDGKSNKLVLPNFGSKSKSHSGSSCSDTLSKPKRLRLDMTEEANELPEQKSDSNHTAQQILSFKNVPDLRPTSTTNNLLNSVKIFSTNSLHSFLQPSTIPKPQQVVSPVVQPVVQKVDKVEKLPKGESLLSSKSSDCDIFLELLSQPESQHRARYQTEGSRGAVKDRSGQGHPVVKLNGYCKSAVLKVFVASDGDSNNPHMFYQACKVTGKNSTPCTEIKEDGTIILLIDMIPENDMTVSCDCVGILKERNVDVEKRIKSLISGGRKKSHKCRLVFRTSVTLKSGKKEELQVVSQPISCSQPPGLPEICRKSLSKSSVEGGEELFIIGKNFSKDTEVVFQKYRKNQQIWTQKMIPDKEYLQGAHLICKVPPYHDTSITESVDVQVLVVSNGKKSDSHTFTYEPLVLKKEPQDSVQLKSFTKGFSPSAVKLNGLYVECGDLNLPKGTPTLSSKQTEQVKILNGQLVKEKAVVHPMIFNCTISGSNTPIVDTKTYTKMDSINSNTFSTSVLSSSNVIPASVANANLFVPMITSTIAPVSSILPDGKMIALTSHPITVNSQLQKVETEFKTSSDDEKTKDLKIAESSDHLVVENLCQMLKFVYALPVKLQSSLLELLSNELLTHIKGKEVSSDKPIAESGISNRPNWTSPVMVEPKVPEMMENVIGNDQKDLKSEQNIISCGNLNVSFGSQIPISSNHSYILPMAIIPPRNSNKHINQNHSESSFASCIASRQSAATHTVGNKSISQNILKQGLPETRQFNLLPVVQSVQAPNYTPIESTVSHQQVDFLSLNRKSNISEESRQSHFVSNVCNAQKPMQNASDKPQFLLSNFPSSEMCEDLKAVNSLESLFTSTPNFDYRQQPTITPMTPFILTPRASTISRRALLIPNHSQNARIFAEHIPTEVTKATSFMQSSVMHSELSEGKERQSNMLLHVSENCSVENNCFSNSTLSNRLQESDNIVDESTQATSYPHSLESTMNANLGSIPTTYDLSSVMQSENCDPLLSQASNSPSLHIGQSHSDTGNSNNFNTMNSVVSSEVTTTLPQLSESELLSYINPNCFDHV